MVATNRVILTVNVVGVGIIGQAAMLLMEEHELRGLGALDVGQVDVNHHEEDEEVHQEVVDDAHMHCTTDQVKTISRAAREVDPKAFINVIRTDQIIGRFYTRPND